MANIYEIKKRVNDLTKAMDRLSKDHDTLKTHVFQLADNVERMEKSAKIDGETVKALSERVEQLGQMVENKMDQVLCDTVQTLTTFTEERTSDGGTMTIKNSGCYIDIVNVLMSNGYFVCCHVDDENNGETITIEYWRA